VLLHSMVLYMLAFRRLDRLITLYKTIDVLMLNLPDHPFNKLDTQTQTNKSLFIRTWTPEQFPDPLHSFDQVFDR